jgi:hypothetical protein
MAADDPAPGPTTPPTPPHGGPTEFPGTPLQAPVTAWTGRLDATPAALPAVPASSPTGRNPDRPTRRPFGHRARIITSVGVTAVAVLVAVSLIHRIQDQPPVPRPGLDLVPGDISWGRSSAYCYQNPDGHPNLYRYHIVNISGSPSSGHLRFDRTLESWDSRSTAYVAVNTSSGWDQAVSSSLRSVISYLAANDAGRACAHDFTAFASHQPTQLATGFTFGSWSS